MTRLEAWRANRFAIAEIGVRALAPGRVSRYATESGSGITIQRTR